MSKVFDPYSMSDQELTTTQLNLHKRLVYAQRFSSSGDLVAQLYNMIKLCEAAQADRLNRAMFELMNRNREDETFLTVSDQDNNEDDSEAVVEKKKVKVGGSVFRKPRSSTPVKD